MSQGSSSGPLAVIVTGLPATGKTAVARRLSADHGLPLACKDEFKELLFDTLGWSAGTPEAREWSRQLGRSAAAALLLFLKAHAQAGRPCIIESNFPPGASAELKSLMAETPFRPFQVVCRTRGDVLWARFVERVGQRHPGHGDEALVDELRPMLLAADYAALDLPGVLWELDTTVWPDAEITALSAAVSAAL